jgi:hypothetical protein
MIRSGLLSKRYTCGFKTKPHHVPLHDNPGEDYLENAGDLGRAYHDNRGERFSDCSADLDLPVTELFLEVEQEG